MGCLNSFLIATKIKKMRDNAADNFAHALTIVPECYKTQKMCNKIVSSYLSAIQFVPECKYSQEMCVKAGASCLFCI